jgi:hypothetical protein
MGRKWRDISSLTINEVENIALYFGLCVIIVLNFLIPFVPALNRYFSQSSVPFYLAILVITRILMKKMDEIRVILALPSAPTSDFNYEIRQLFKRHPKSRTIDILATNTRKFYHAMEDLQFYAGEIRILLYEQTPAMDSIVERWKALYERGICRKLEIRTYEFTPTFYGVSIDRKEGYFGFFDPAYMANPQVSLGLMQITGPYLLTKTNPMGRAILEDIQKWFDVAFKHHTKELYASG